MTVFGDPIWSEVFSILNIAVFGALAVTSWKLRDGHKRFRYAASIVFTIIGLYWAALYIFVLFTPSGSIDGVMFGRLFVRPEFTLTGGAMLMLALRFLRIDK